MSRVCTGIKGEIFEMKEMVSLKMQRGKVQSVFGKLYSLSNFDERDTVSKKRPYYSFQEKAILQFPRKIERRKESRMINHNDKSYRMMPSKAVQPDLS